MMFQCALALEYLHHQDICHRDIKTSNVLIFEDETHKGLVNAKLCDLGMCKFLTSDHINSGHISTTCYKAPEVVMGNGAYEKGVDIWALGIMFFEMFNMNYPFRSMGEKTKQTDTAVMQRLFQNRGTPSEELFKFLSEGGKSPIAYKKIQGYKKQSIREIFDMKQQALRNFHENIDPVKNFGTIDQYIDLLEKTIEVDPRLRIGITDVINHSFFDSIPYEDPKGTWMGLVKQKLQPRKFHTLERIKDNDLRCEVLELFATMPVEVQGNTCYNLTSWRIIFLAIDIFDRVALFLEDELSDPNGKVKNAKFIAVCCGYMACKYFMDEASPKLEVLFPYYRIKSAKLEKFLTLEKNILNNCLCWEIYRPTIYDLLTKKLAPISLFDVMKKPNVFYGNGKTVDELARVFQDVIMR
jgi:hypothetical protein